MANDLGVSLDGVNGTGPGGRIVRADVRGARQLPYELIDQPGMVALNTRQGVKTPVEVSAR